MNFGYSEKKILRLGLIMIALALLAMFLAKNHQFVSILLFVIIATFLGTFIKFHKGQMAEYDVTDELNNLPPEWYYDWDLNFQNRGNIDVAAVGPTGVWAIEVKSHSGTISFQDGQLLRNNYPFEKNFIKQAWAEAYALRDFLTNKLNQNFKVQPVLLFSNPEARMKFGMKQINGIYIINRKWLLDLVQKNVVQNLDENSISL